MVAIDRVSTTGSVNQLRDFSARGQDISSQMTKLDADILDNSAQTVSAESKKEISLDETVEAVEILNETMDLYNHKLHFEIHEATNRIKVAIVDKKTDEVIKEIPPEEVLNMLAKIHDMLGILVDKRI